MSFNISIEVLHDKEFIIAVYQIIKEALEVAIGAISHLIHNQTHIGIGVVLIPCTVAAMIVKINNLLGTHTEDYAVFIPYLLMNLYISTVHSSQGNSTVHHELHVTSTGSLLGSCGNLLADIGCRIYLFTQRYPEVLQEDNLNLAINAWICINLVSYSQNQANSLLGYKITRSSLAAKEIYNWYRHLVLRIVLQTIILIHNMHDIHQLTLVGMNTLYLYIKDRINLDAYLVVRPYILSKSTLSSTLYLVKLLQEG